MAGPSPTISDPVADRPVNSLRALGNLRQKVRRAFLLDGGVGMALMLFALTLAAFLLDYTLVLPRGVRAVLLAAGGLYLVWFGARRILAPRRIPMSDEDLAILVEARSPQLSGALIAAVELSRPGHRGATHLSRDLIRAVVGQVEGAGGGVQAGQVIDLRPVRQNAVLLALLIAAIVLGGAFRPDLVGIWLGRFYLLRDEPWPQNTALEMVVPRENPVYVFLGEDLEVQVRAVRGDPGNVEVEIHESKAEERDRNDYRPRSWRDRMVQGADGIYRRTFENVSRKFSFSVTGGDAQLGPIEVDVRLEPSLSRLDAWYRYPEYTGLDPTPPDKPLSNPPLISVPAGTRVGLRAWCDLPVDRAFFVFVRREEARDEAAGPPKGGPPDASAPWPDPGALEVPVLAADPKPPPLDPDGAPLPVPERTRSMLDFSFPVDADGQFFFQLRSTDGVRGRKGKTVSVRAIPDRPPMVKIIEPGRASEEVTAEATVPMEFLARHTYGIRSMSLEAMVVPADAEKGEPVSFPLFGPAAGTREAKNECRSTFVLELAKVRGIAPGTKFQYFAQADDFGSQAPGRSDGYVLHIITKEDMKRILSDRLMLLRDQLREIARDQESARKDLLGYQDELDKAAPAREKGLSLDAAAAARLIRNRQDQERITARLSRTAKDFDALLGKREANRIGDEKEKVWIAGIKGEVEAFAAARSPAIVKGIEDLRTEALRAPQPPDRLSPVTDGEAKLQRDIMALADRLSQFGDVNWVIQQLQDVKRRQEEVRDRTRRRAAGGAAAPEEPRPDDEGK